VTRTYLALTKRTGGPSGGSLLHLIREDADTSLCGIPRSSLTGGGMFDQIVCAACLLWFERRRAVSGEASGSTNF
jgi:hypothetical protein